LAIHPSISARRALKYVGLMGFFNMVNEVAIIKQRDYFLQRNYMVKIGGVRMKMIHENVEAQPVAEKNKDEDVKEVKFKASNFKDIKRMFEEKKRADEEANKSKETKETK
jgi:hypothetical protein